MPTISAKISKKELDAITEYTNACGETVSNLIRKVMVGDAIMINCFHDVKEYEVEISVPDNAQARKKIESFKDLLL